MPVTVTEIDACTPKPVVAEGFNPNCRLPYGLRVEHVAAAMREFVDFLGFVNQQLHGRGIPRLESTMMAANFSSLVGEFVGGAIPRHCSGLARNRYHNGHPDLLPKGEYPGDSVQYGDKGIEVKASRYAKGWQGHNAESCWLLVLVFDANGPRDEFLGKPPKPFEFLAAYCAKLEKSDWQFAGRKEGSRRTITASVNSRGHAKMIANWIYRAPGWDG